MALSYNKLWKLLIDKNLRKSDLHLLTGISQSTIAKLSKGENVNTDILEKICRVLNCEIGDIVEIQEELK
ncbi:MAG: helix-turn-helix transcriptional regulator [Clostridia bacterium]|nr:helix-turn-helix transcriptional regulator [Clostridia bacterium]